jgi:hypothetical protein
MSLGIEASLKVENFILEAGQSIAKSLEDGKFELGDAVNFVSPLLLVPQAISALGDVPEEFKDLEMVEGLQFIDNAVAKIPQLSDKHVKILKAALKLVVDGVELYNAVKG